MENKSGEIDRKKVFNNLVSEFIKLNPETNGKDAQKNVADVWKDIKLQKDCEIIEAVNKQIRIWRERQSQKKKKAHCFFGKAKSNFFNKLMCPTIKKYIFNTRKIVYGSNLSRRVRGISGEVHLVTI